MTLLLIAPMLASLCAAIVTLALGWRRITAATSVLAALTILGCGIALGFRVGSAPHVLAAGLLRADALSVVMLIVIGVSLLIAGVPFAGVLAIMVSDFGAFGKLFSEAIEAADRKQVEGIRASGGNALHEIRFGLLPQVLPVFISQALYMVESNTRSATIIGIVGAGGIGLHLAEMIRTYEWDRVAFIVLMVLVTVSVIDLLSTRIRLAIAGGRGPMA